ncbi:hypothetical protein [Aerosakkonema funiforme]|nr:hypothetical protein [Aerosakkonema funiforme]
MKWLYNIRQNFLMIPIEMGGWKPLFFGYIMSGSIGCIKKCVLICVNLR